MMDTSNKTVHVSDRVFYKFLRERPYICVICAFVSCIVHFIMMELVNGDLSRMIFPQGLLNIVVIMFVACTFFALTGNLRAAMVLAHLFLFVFTLTCYFVCLFRGVPLLAPDLLVAGTALSVAGGFSFSLSGISKAYILIVFLMIFFFGVLPSDIRIKGKMRLKALIVYIIFLILFLYLFVFSDTLKSTGVTVSHFNPQKSYAENGSLLTFIRSGQMAVLQKPEGYFDDKADKLLEPYEKAYSEDKTDYKRPNVIVMMNEAFSDVQTVGKGFETDKDVMPFIHSLNENTVKGTAYSSVFGGYTANSEFEFLTGLSMENLGGVAPFQFLIKSPMDSLARELSKQGYAPAMAMHPYIKSGYQRPLAYSQLGFSYYRGLEDMEDKGYDRIRGYISDSSDVKELISMYETIRDGDDRPVFLYNVTMQNHAPYNGSYDDFTSDVYVSDEELRTPDLENYLSLIRLSDEAFRELTEYFSQTEEDTVIVLFGDHEPKLGGRFYKKMLGKKVSKLSAAESMQRYKVPYVIWTNYDIEEKQYGDISLNYLSSIMADAAGMKQSPLQRYLMDMRRTLPVITAIGCYDGKGDFYGADDENNPYREMLSDYECIRYRAFSR